MKGAMLTSDDPYGSGVQTMGFAFADVLGLLFAVALFGQLAAMADPAAEALRRTDATGSADRRPALTLVYRIDPAGALALDPEAIPPDLDTRLEALGPDENVLLVVPLDATHAAVLAETRALAGRTQAQFQSVETTP